MKSHLALGAALLLGLHAAGPLAAADTAARPPNIVIIFADDLGYGDLGCYGHPTIRTPHLDRMAAEGMRFTSFYSAANVCTPSRAALLTGRLPVRNGMTGRRMVLFPDSVGGLPTTEITIARALKTRGYTTAAVGKWHLGHRAEFLPTRHGFDSYYGIPYSNDMDRAPESPRGMAAFTAPKSEYWKPPVLRDDREIARSPDQTKLTADYTTEALKFIRANKTRPFFLYLAHSMPHVPLFASDKFRGKSRRGLYGDVIEELDWSVGQVLDALRSEQLDRNTLVFFTSDNGPWLTYKEQGGSAGLLRDGKASTWDGGMREPGIAWWPGRIKAGQVNADLATTMDLFTTSLKLAGAEVPRDRVIDGVDLSPALFDGRPGPRQVHFFYHTGELYAVRKGAFKAHLITHSGYARAAPEKHSPPLLFNLEVDPGESFNIAAGHPEVVADLLAEIEKHRATVAPVESQLDKGYTPPPAAPAKKS